MVKEDDLKRAIKLNNKVRRLQQEHCDIIYYPNDGTVTAYEVADGRWIEPDPEDIGFDVSGASEKEIRKKIEIVDEWLKWYATASDDEKYHTNFDHFYDERMGLC